MADATSGSGMAAGGDDAAPAGAQRIVYRRVKRLENGRFAPAHSKEGVPVLTPIVLKSGDDAEARRLKRQRQEQRRAERGLPPKKKKKGDGSSASAAGGSGGGGGTAGSGPGPGAGGAEKLEKIAVWNDAMGQMPSEADLRPLAAVDRVSRRRLRFTSAAIVPAISGTARNVTSTFARGKSQALVDPAAVAPDPTLRGEDVLVIEPGSRYLRIGLASQGLPRTVPHVLARRYRPAAPFDGGGLCGLFEELPSQSQTGQREQQLTWIDSILRERLKTFKKKTAQLVSGQVASFNGSVQPRSIPEHSDPQPANWNETEREFYVGDARNGQALRLPSYENVRLFFPIQRGHLNLAEAPSREIALMDMEALWSTAIEEELSVPRARFKDLSVLLVIPDGMDRSEAAVLVDLLLARLQFKAAMVQQAATCAAFGAGLSSALVVNVGAQTVSVACVDEGISLPPTRIALPYGGDDVTRLLLHLLRGAQFPYASCRLATVHDFLALEAVKERYCTCVEADVNVVNAEFSVRRHGKPTLQFPFRMFDQIIKAPLVLFHPLMLEDEPARRLAAWAMAFAADSEDYMDETFLNSVAPPPTRHMLKHLQKAQKTEGGASDEDEDAAGSADEEDGDEDVDADGSDAEAPAPSQASQSGTPRLSPKSAAKAGPGPVATVRLVLGNGDGPAAPPQAPKPRPAAVKGAGATPVPTPAPTPATSGSGPTPTATPAPAAAPPPFPTPTPVPVGIPLGPAGPVAKPAATTGPLPGKHTVPTGPLSTSTFVFPTRRPPPAVVGLDEAIVNSVQTLDDERQRRLLMSILLVGGSSLVPGLSEILEARLLGRLPEDKQVQVLAKTRDIDPRQCVWKGASVLGRLESNRDTWISASEWSVLGVRMLREKCYFEWF